MAAGPVVRGPCSHHDPAVAPDGPGLQPQVRTGFTQENARALSVSGYTVQDHLKPIFSKIDVRSRGVLVGQIFLDHDVTHWEARQW